MDGILTFWPWIAWGIGAFVAAAWGVLYAVARGQYSA
jgi:hypothetical protein